jgi:cation-transporting ATPase E
MRPYNPGSYSADRNIIYEAGGELMGESIDKSEDLIRTAITGLNATEVAKRYEAGQYNKPPQSATKSIRRIFFNNIASVFNLIIGFIMVFLLAFYFGTKDQRLLLDAVGVFTVAFFNTTIAIFQEVKAKRALDEVNMLLTREVNVLRDQMVSSISQEKIVIDDVIVLQRGDQAVVDGVVLQSNHMEIDESLLTGESLPIEKEPDNKILSGSFCLSGNGYYRVTHLSDNSYASKLTQLAQQLKITLSPLQQQVNRIVLLLFVAALLLGILVTSIAIYNQQIGAEFARKIATILIGLVPQGLVLMASVTFAIGIYRISKVGAIVQAFNAIDSFANVQVICMDKTGTLTQNRMTVRKITLLTDNLSQSALETLLGTYAKFSSDKNATIRALEIFTAALDSDLGYELPFSSQRKMSILSIKSQGRENVYVLGAFEILAEHCSKEHRDYSLQAAVEAKLDVYRNLMFGEILNPEAIDRRSKDLAPLHIKPLAITSLSDTVREDVADVIKDFESKGIRFKILSGDSATSILATCRDIDWFVDDKDIVTGTELDSFDEAELQEVVNKRVVFARLRPEHKVKIIEALRANNIYTAMIGDGVNDVPAIKRADLGMAMDEGASITKEVADIVLLKNRFTLLPEIFEEGKKIINTVSSIARLFLTKNFMVIYLTLVSALLFLDFPLTPRRVALINIFAIGLPAMIIALTNTNTSRHKRFVLDLLSFVAVSALVIVVAGYAGFYLIKDKADTSESGIQTAYMVMLSIMIITSIISFLIVAALGGKKKRGLYLVYAASIIATYVLVAATQADNMLLTGLKTFYELSVMSADGWFVVLIVCGISSFILIGAQRLRLKLISQ